MADIYIDGDAIGKYNIITYGGTMSQDISTFNTSLCAVQTVSVSKASIRTYAPGNPINSFTTFNPTSSYLILAKANFVIAEQFVGGPLLVAENNTPLITQNDVNIIV